MAGDSVGVDYDEVGGGVFGGGEEGEEGRVEGRGRGEVYGGREGKEGREGVCVGVGDLREVLEEGASAPEGAWFVTGGGIEHRTFGRVKSDRVGDSFGARG